MRFGEIQVSFVWVRGVRRLFEAESLEIEGSFKLQRCLHTRFYADKAACVERSDELRKFAAVQCGYLVAERDAVRVKSRL